MLSMGPEEARMLRVVVPLIGLLVACANPLPLVEPGDAGAVPPDAGAAVDAGQAISVEGCQFIGAFNRIGFRGEAGDAGPCVRLMLLNTFEGPDGGPLELPPGWVVDSATSQNTACPITWQGAADQSTGDVSGFVRLPDDGGAYPVTATLDVTLRFDGGIGTVRMTGFNVPLNTSCVP